MLLRSKVMVVFRLPSLCNAGALCGITLPCPGISARDAEGCCLLSEPARLALHYTRVMRASILLSCSHTKSRSGRGYCETITSSKKSVNNDSGRPWFSICCLTSSLVLGLAPEKHSLGGGKAEWVQILQPNPSERARSSELLAQRRALADASGHTAEHPRATVALGCPVSPRVGVEGAIFGVQREAKRSKDPLGAPYFDYQRSWALVGNGGHKRQPGKLQESK